MFESIAGLPGIGIFTSVVFEDDRGFFMEAWNQQAFDAAVGEEVTFVQDNHSRSARGVVRALHYQLPPDEQGKLVRCIRGEIFDIAVDIRRSSPAFGRWVGVELTAENRQQLWIPAGFAHGFMALTDGAEVLYKTTSFHAPQSERSIRWDDPTIGIEWPDPAGGPLLNDRDAAAPPLDQAETFA